MSEQSHVDECLKKMHADREAILSFYDARIVFAGYSEILSALGASLIATGVYPREVVAHLLADMLADSITRESKTKIVYSSGTDGVEGGTQ